MSIMYTVFAILFVLLVSMTTTDAWFFYRRYPTAKANEKAPERSCTIHAMRGNCEFYSCFEKRFSCGKNWYNVKYGEPYCKDFKAFQFKFSPMGQKFINETEQCLTRELHDWYLKDSMNCHDYTHFAVKAMSRCYIKNGFCDVIKEDAINFATIYHPRHLFTRGAFKLWREILRIAYHCEPQGFQDIVTTFWESIRE